MEWGRSNVSIQSVEGERAMVKDNRVIGQFDICGIPTDDSKVQVI